MAEYNGREGGGWGFGLGLMAGTLFGIGLGMLLAPKAGSELRNELGAKARQAGDTLANQYRQANDTASGWAERGREAAERGRAAVERGRQAVTRGIDEAKRYASNVESEIDQTPKM